MTHSFSFCLVVLFNYHYYYYYNSIVKIVDQKLQAVLKKGIIYMRLYLSPLILK